MRNGEADAVFADKDFLVAIVDEDPDMSFVGEDVPLGGGVGMGLREGDPLRDTFDAVITELKADGTLNEMIVRWFGEEATVYDLDEVGGR